MNNDIRAWKDPLYRAELLARARPCSIPPGSSS
jgi:hypothetical protein